MLEFFFGIKEGREEEALKKKLWGESFIGVKASTIFCIFIIKIQVSTFQCIQFFSSVCIAFLTSCILFWDFI